MRRNFYLFISLLIATQALHASETPTHSLITSEPRRGTAEEQREFLPHLTELTESIPLKKSEIKILAKVQEFAHIQELLRTLTPFKENEEVWEKSLSQYKQIKEVDTHTKIFGDAELSQEEIAEWKKEKIGQKITPLQVASVFIAARNDILKSIHQSKSRTPQSSPSKQPAAQPSLPKSKKKKSKALTLFKKKMNNKALQKKHDMELINQFTKSNNQQTTSVKKLQDFLTGTKKESPAITNYDSNAISIAFDKAVEHYGFNTKLKEHKFGACDEIIDTIEKVAFPLYSYQIAEETFKSKIIELENKLWKEESKSVPYIIGQLSEKNKEYNSLPNGDAKMEVEDKISSLVGKLLKASPTNPEEKESKAQFLKGFNKGNSKVKQEKLINQIKDKNIKINTSNQSKLNKTLQPFENSELKEAILELKEHFPENTLIVDLHQAIDNSEDLLKEILNQQITTLKTHNKVCQGYIQRDTEKKEILAKDWPNCSDEKTVLTIEKQIQRLDESIKHYTEKILNNNQKILDNEKELGHL